MDKVKVWTEDVNIPTYETGEYSKIPMFLDKRVYQGSSGKVYPHPVCESVSDEKKDKTYTAVFLENKYLLVMVLPEIGGKIHRILDKTNNYDAVYYNEVIKPALVGLAGPWVSGGIEFNWPQHHRPSTFDPIDYTLQENPDGSATIFVSEIEKMHRTKGMAKYTLYPDKAYLEIKGQLYNQTDRPQTFLWWANPAVAVNEHTKSVFPPDVHAVMDHGKRDVSRFPISTSTYYKMDYSEGIDISRYKNIPVPTSYMAYHSDYDFIGNYDYSREAGLLHIADHHISPGKKQWTWGCGDFGKAWDRNLTDENGPYIELMTGMFTDNQPDFTFIAPYEEKTFTQYFLPYKAAGNVKNATLDAVMNLEVQDNKAFVSVYSPDEKEIIITLTGKIEKYISEKIMISPEKPFVYTSTLKGDKETDLTLTVKDAEDNILCSYTPAPYKYEKTPAPAEPCEKPENIHSIEELYLTALHLEQYRHATYSPERYYIEGLRRDATDIRLNNAYGRYLYNNGEFQKAEKHFKAAIKKSTWKNPNPYDCEPYYNLGLALRKQKKFDEAFDAFYKSVWDSNMQSRGFYQLACISSMRGDYKTALEFTEQSLLSGVHNLKARNLKTTLLRLSGKFVDAKRYALETMEIDPLNYGCRYELYKATDDFTILNELTTIMRNDVDNYIELSLDYNEFGLYDEAAKVLALISEADRPMLHYYMAYYSKSDVELEIASKCKCDYCFPVRLNDILVLEYALAHNDKDANAPYLLGNLLYDKGQWERALECWKLSSELNEKNPIVHRNLSLVFFNKLHDTENAIYEMERALRYAPDDARIFYELDLLYKETNMPTKKRLKLMSDSLELVYSRDDLYTEFITLLNSEGYFDKAMQFISSHKFHPWEGGEGKITAQYRKTMMALANNCIENGDFEGADNYLTSALSYPENLGEGKLYGALDNDIYYMLGKTYEKIDFIKAKEYYALAMRGNAELSGAVYYNDQPPEMLYYQALAADALGKTKQSRGMFNKLISYGLEHMEDNAEADYFAVSLPDFLVFEPDLNRKNRVTCSYLAALGYYGIGDKEKAQELTDKSLSENISHQGLLELKKQLKGN
jgi:tetratricopeptide (TPR) repeat protein